MHIMRRLLRLFNEDSANELLSAEEVRFFAGEKKKAKFSKYSFFTA